MASKNSPGQLVAQWLATICAAATLGILIKNQVPQGSAWIRMPAWMLIAPAGATAALLFVVLGPPLYRRTLERARQRRTMSALRKLWPHFLLRVGKLSALLDGTNTRSAQALVGSVRVPEDDSKSRDAMAAAAAAISVLNALAHDVQTLSKDAPKNIEDARRLVNHFETIWAGFYTLGVNKRLNDLCRVADQGTWADFWHDWNDLRNDYLRWADGANTDLKGDGKVFGATDRLRQWHS